ncbi:MAG: class I SAM-dependent methyltransferase [Candidatus Paceibacterota bacterium]|jgi:ubiquinone/menaquinone biosynthesis C-methylase UbiE
MNRFYPIKIYFNIVKMFLVRTFLRRGITNRDQPLVINDYRKSWGEGYRSVIWGRKLRVLRVNGRLTIGRAIDSRKFFIAHINKFIRSVGPKQVLELGSGIGINILALAVLNPNIKSFKGIELTAEGVEQARSALKDIPVKELMYLTEEDEATIRQRLANRDIEFIQGDILHLPWHDKSFDFVFSCWVIEQLPRQYREAFLEAKRVLKGHALFIEEFKEAQENIFQLLHLNNVDYFHASFAEVGKLGFKILGFEPMAMSKIKFTYGSLFCSANL